MNLAAFIKDIKNSIPIPIRKGIKKIFKKYRDLRNYYHISVLHRSLDKKQIKNALKRLGIGTGDTILVHSSLSRLGRVEGGSQTVIESLFETVGPTGTVGVPTFWGLTKNYLAGERTFDVSNSPSILGAVTEKIRKHPNSKRSLHPTHSVAFIGPQAEFLVKNHHIDDTPFGPNSPYRKLIEINGKILLLGVTIEYMTSLHTIEDLIPDFPVSVYRKSPISFDVIDSDGNAMEVSSLIHCKKAAKNRNSLKLMPYFEKGNLIKECKIGIGTARLIDSKKLHQTMLSLYEKGITMYHK